MLDHHTLTFTFVKEQIETRRREAHVVGLLRRARRAVRGDAETTSTVIDLPARLVSTAPTAPEPNRLPVCCGPACGSAPAGA